MPSYISRLIDWICCEMTCQARHGENVGQRLRLIFDRLQIYRWTTQVLLVLAAFALQYGDFCCAHEAPPEGGHVPSTPFPKALSSLKRKVVPDGNKKGIKPLNKVASDLCELTSSLFDLTEMVNQHRGKHVPELAKAFRSIPGWSCETIIAILAAGNIFDQITGGYTEFPESEVESLKSSVSNRKSTVLAKVDTCKKEIGLLEQYLMYMKKVEAPVDIADFLRSLLAKDSKQNPFVIDPNNTAVEFKGFRKKNVLLIISDQKISDYDIATLERIHHDPRRVGIPKEEDRKDDVIQIQTEKETLYELVWIPIVDAGHDRLEALPSFKSVRRLAFVVDPLKMNKFASRYIKEEWRFKRETMVVVLDALGWVENADAMPMLRTWETEAFPYTGNESTHPWLGQSWSWVRLVLREQIVRHGTLDAPTKTDYKLIYGGTAAATLATEVTGENANLSVMPIEDPCRFFILLRSCLISRLQAVQILNIERDPLRDRIVYEMCEAHKAFQSGGVAIIAKGHDLQVLHVGLMSDLKSVRDQVANNEWKALAEGHEKKYKEALGQSMCLHVYVPHHANLGDLYCPGCSRFMRHDLRLTCCHSESD
ncbi:protein SIEVE ELEMENT OCCLUSION B-like [Rhodamnia argentea]|uniref:Protein SIEVE ELEMENT OCCLUSION B-like n=1 Tax=Rhodamnia argentea TaxID=178133 RepID=A0A8B8Q2F0_9MYRT|nr:protein SIEVE ELEMENT OCCLUSION B-like [Rhodamnia argentea]